MPKKACSTCRHYQTEGFDVMKGWCHWFDAYPGMQPEALRKNAERFEADV